MFARNNRFMFFVGLMLSVGILVIFVFGQSPKHKGHGEMTTAPIVDTPSTSSPFVTTVNIQNNQFSPSTLNITAGTTVRWNWVNGFHTSTSGTCCTPNNIWNSGDRGPGSTFDFTFSTPGTFPYFCEIHGQTMTGQVIVAPAATATISGRVLGTSGRGIKRAIVTLTDQNNVVRSVTANNFGFYQFDNVATGQNYTIRVQARRYTFTPRSLTVNGNLTNEDLICQAL